MIYTLYAAVTVSLAAMAVFVWTAIRSAAKQIIENTADQRAQLHTPSHWTTRNDLAPFTVDTDDDPDAPVGFVETAEPLYGASADKVRDALRAGRIEGSRTPGVRPQNLRLIRGTDRS